VFVLSKLVIIPAMVLAYLALPNLWLAFLQLTVLLAVLIGVFITHLSNAFTALRLPIQ
jgi:hypothetical protein